jgi:serine/threonine-protein kinase
MSGPRPGSRLGGRYRLTERLAFGGMGEVWQGIDEILGRDVAIKILRSDLAGDNAFQRRFREEARTAGGLSHPGIAAVYDYGESPLAPPINETQETPVHQSETSYLVMELVPGEPLSAVLSREAPLDVDRTLDLIAQTARALHAAHMRGVVHRDVKPANLMVTPDHRVKVTDFGIARPQDHEPLTATGQVMGTAHYLAPELARGHEATPLSDVYALGVVIYECLAGRRPFEGDNQVAVATAHLAEPPPPLPETLQPEIRRIVEISMEKEPGLRFRGANAFAAALESARYRILAGLPPAADVFLGDPPPDQTDTVPLTTPVAATSRTSSTSVWNRSPGQSATSGSTPMDGLSFARRRLPLVPLLLAALSVLVIGGIVIAVTLPDSENQGTTTPTTTTPTTSPSSIVAPSTRTSSTTTDSWTRSSSSSSATTTPTTTTETTSTTTSPTTTTTAPTTPAPTTTTPPTAGG